MKTASFVVTGLRCGGCSSKLQQRLNELEGMRTAQVNFATSRGDVEFDEKTVSLDQILSIAQGMNLTVEVINVSTVEKEGCEMVTIKTSGASSSQHCLRFSVESPSKGLNSIIQAAVDNFEKEDGVHIIHYDAKKRLLTVTLNAQKIHPRDFTQRFVTEMPIRVNLTPLPSAIRTNSKNEAIESVKRLAAAAIPACWCLFHGMTTNKSIHENPLMTTAAAVSALFIWAYGGFEVHRAALEGLVRGVYTMDTLISMSTTITLFYSLAATVVSVVTNRHLPLFFESSAGVLLAVLTGRAIESAVRYIIVGKLRIFESSTGGKRYTVVGGPLGAADNVASQLIGLGDILSCNDGEVIPVDALLEQQDPVILDEAIISGEARPVKKLPKERLLCGSRIVQGGPVLVRACAIGTDSFLGQLQAMIDEGCSKKQRNCSTQGFADKLAAKFTILVLILASLTLTVWTVLVYSGIVGPQEDNWLHKVLFISQFPISVISVACPCALGLATPIAVAATTAAAAKRGIIIRNFNAVYHGAKRISCIVWDKTGTLTSGDMRLTGVMCVATVPKIVDPIPRIVRKEVLNSDDQWQLMAICTSVLWKSAHPIARAVCEFSREHFKTNNLPEIKQLSEVAGRGVTGILNNTKIVIGTEEFCKEFSSDAANSNYFFTRTEDTTITIAVGGHIVGYLTLTNPPRCEAREIIKKLARKKIVSYICSGDSIGACRAVGRACNISLDNIKAGMLPEQKVELIEELKGCVSEENIGLVSTKKSKKPIIMVGDGVNDALALTAADIGIAMPSRLAQVTYVAADIVLLNNNLFGINSFLNLCKHSIYVIRGNLIWALAFNIIALPSAAGVFYPKIMLAPAVAGGLMALSSIMVVAMATTLLIHAFMSRQL